MLMLTVRKLWNVTLEEVSKRKLLEEKMGLNDIGHIICQVISASWKAGILGTA